MTRRPGSVDSVEPDDGVPVSIRLGEVVPPEDPEDWRRPLTWIAAAGMLAGPATMLGWLALAPPGDAGHPLPATWLVAAALPLGAAASGATQIGAPRAFAATLGAALFGALVVVVVAVVLGGERQSGVAPPALAHAFAAAVGGLAGSCAAATLAAPLAGRAPRVARWAIPGAVGAAAGALVVPHLFAAP
ncbi:MAG TPA: hypothetical protein VHK06_00675 [Candidatus Limnocylindria bacterium]|nr:hypothetical protein [Candidatus Limnocylindria bacterium]